MYKSLLYIVLVIGAVFMAVPAHAAISYHDGDVIREDVTWRGEVLVDGVLFVPETVTLTIGPGTIIRLTKSDAVYRESGVSEVVIPGSGIRVEGTVIAEGTQDRVITFTSAEKEPVPGAWGCIFFDHSKGSVFRYCRFEYSTYTLHAHFSSLDVSRSVITRNMDGSRLGYSRVLIDHCEINGNTGKGLNFANCRNTVRYCEITGNNEGIFLNQKDAASVIEENNIHGNARFDLSLGEFHDEDMPTGVNWWGSADAEVMAAKVYDKADDPEIGRAFIRPARREIPNAGVAGLDVKLNWKFRTGGFVDSSPAIEGGRVYFGSWDKNLYCVDEKTGELVWKFETGDCVDSSPAVGWGKVYFGSWDRNIYCLDAETGEEVWRFTMEPSEFDDHRQASPVLDRNSLYMGGFNGILYRLEAETGKELWRFSTGGPIRSKPLVASARLAGDECGGERTLVMTTSSDGRVYAVSAMNAGMLWDYRDGDRVTSSAADNDGKVYFGCGDGKICALELASGNKLWNCQTAGRIEYSSPLLKNGLAIIGSADGKLYALEAKTGKPAWSFDTVGVIYSSPRDSGNMVAIANNDGAVCWLDPITGEPKAVSHAKDAVQGLSAGPGGVIYAGSRDGYLYSLSVGK